MAKCIKCEHPREAHNCFGVHQDYRDGACLYNFCPCNEFETESPKEYEFDFVVSFPGFPEVGDEMAKALMDLVIQFAETFHGQVGGGFKEANNENAE